MSHDTGPPSLKKPRLSRDIIEQHNLEEGGHFGDSSHISGSCNGVDCSKPFGAVRVTAFVNAFKRLSHTLLQALTQACRTAIKSIPRRECGQDGQHFLDTCFANTAFAYGLLQVSKASDRYDPEHYDGGASLVHGGLAIWGSRTVEHESTSSLTEIQTLDKSGVVIWNKTPQEPGSFYIGSLCAVKHRVAHRKDAEHLYKRFDSSRGVHINVMLRTNVFGGSQSRAMVKAPSPNCVYDAVNRATASFIRSNPFEMPVFSDVVAELL
jgi:hypothetical protein